MGMQWQKTEIESQIPKTLSHFSKLCSEVKRKIRVGWEGGLRGRIYTVMTDSSCCMSETSTTL